MVTKVQCPTSTTTAELKTVSYSGQPAYLEIFYIGVCLVFCLFSFQVQQIKYQNKNENFKTTCTEKYFS
jgi:hypothetical protein